MNSQNPGNALLNALLISRFEKITTDALIIKAFFAPFQSNVTQSEILQKVGRIQIADSSLQVWA